MSKKLVLRNIKNKFINNLLINQIKRMLKHRVFEARFQVILWVITLVSICLNIYLIATQFDDVFDVEAVADTSNLYNEDTKGAAEPQKVAEPELPKLLPDSNGIITVDLAKGDTLSKVLKLSQISDVDVEDISKSIARIVPLSHIRNGSRIEIELVDFGKDAQQKAKRVTIYQDIHKVEALYDQANATFSTKKTTLPLQWEVKLVSTTINGSLYSSARKAGADPTIISQLISLFSYNVDFQRDLQIGDGLQIMYEYQTDFRKKVAKNPKILYASINLSGSRKEVYRHESASGGVDYYDAKGNSVKRSLLRTPINGAKISSTYGLRMHPVLGYSRMHQGLDYSAQKGTPILAAGDGNIEFMKNQARGYGKHVQIKHNANYATLYAHMSRFASNIKPGGRVKQGDVIGYVGDTGLASGPHLHYEVIENGKKVNPSKMKAPKILPLKGTELARFKENMRKTGHMVAQLDDNKINAVAHATRY